MRTSSVTKTCIAKIATAFGAAALALSLAAGAPAVAKPGGGHPAAGGGGHPAGGGGGHPGGGGGGAPPGGARPAFVGHPGGAPGGGRPAFAGHPHINVSRGVSPRIH